MDPVPTRPDKGIVLFFAEIIKQFSLYYYSGKDSIDVEKRFNGFNTDFKVN